MVEQNEEFTDDEAALYDRQIRLWGLEAQKRLRSSNVLVAGVKGLGAEICKNIVLAGIKSLKILDSDPVSDEDLSSQFCVTSEDLGKNLAEASVASLRQLNPMVEVTADVDGIDDKPDSFFVSFDVVCLLGGRSSTAARVDHLCRQKGVKFFCGDAVGLFGYMFADLGQHQYADEIPMFVSEKEDSGPPSKRMRSESSVDTKVVKKSLSYVSLERALGQGAKLASTDKATVKRLSTTYFTMQILNRFWEEVGRHPLLASREKDYETLQKLRDQLLQEFSIDSSLFNDTHSRYCFGQLSPICTIVGGVLSQEIIKALSQKDAPIKNFFFFNGSTIQGGMVENIGD